jgi:hypothetical protein
MFARFRQTATRLQVSLIETRRVDGKVRHEHVASLGSISLSPTPFDRFEFWRELHAKLARLSNRIDAETHARILGSVHERVPMPTPDGQAALQLEAAKEDARFWRSIQDMNLSTAEGHKRLAERAEQKQRALEAIAADAGDRAVAAEDRVARLKRGEAVAGGITKPLDVAAILRSHGWSTSDLSHAAGLASLSPAEFALFLDEHRKGMERAEAAVGRTVLRKVRARRTGG